MYDLKSATQLYVLEGHTHRPTACAFSPDGRRLVTVSLEEGVVHVWKVGPSFASGLLHPGRPPRQGGEAGSRSYKTFPFNVGEEGTLGRVSCPCNRGVLLTCAFVLFFSSVQPT